MRCGRVSYFLLAEMIMTVNNHGRGSGSELSKKVLLRFNFLVKNLCINKMYW